MTQETTNQSYEMVEAVNFSNLSPEREPLASQLDQNEDDDQDEDEVSSTTSSLFEEIAQLNGADAQDFETSPSYLQQYEVYFQKRSSKLRWVLMAATLVLIIVSWVYILTSSASHASRTKGTPTSQEIKSTTATLQPEETTPTLSTPTAISSKNVTPLKEHDIHQSREPIQTQTFNGNVQIEDVVFLPCESYLPKSEDEGLYLKFESDNHVVKKNADPTYELVLQKGGKFTHKGTTYTIHSFNPSYDLRYAIVSTDYTPLFRHSGKGKYWFHDLSRNEYTLIKDTDSLVQHASWSPNYNYVTFIQDNNLYLFSTSTKSITKLTEDGSGDIYNGRPDWVYEEEVLSSDRSFWWNSDESQFLYMKTDDSRVKELDLETFINNDKYPNIEKIKYPKPGQNNPVVQLLRYSIESGKTVEIDRSDSTLGSEYIIYGAAWLDSNTFVVKETDRQSKILNYRVVHIESGISKVTYSTNVLRDYNGWVKNFGSILVIHANSTAGRENAGFVDVLVSDGYNHLAYFESGDSKTPIFLTHGDWEVIEAIQLDNEANKIYFSGNRHSSFEKHLYSIGIKSKELTVWQSAIPEDLGYYDASFSPSSRFFIVIKTGPSFPVMNSHDSLLPKRGGLIDFTGATRTYHKIEIDIDEAGNPITANVIEQRPLVFNESEQHPLLVSVYGGPGSQKTDVRFHISLEDTVADELGAVVLYVDPRGTGGQGWKYRSWSNGKIGYWEPRDITVAVKKWIDSRAYIDSERTAIWGWSYGGFTTLKTLEYDAGNVFKYGMAVAPVTDWTMYDSIYTERYMGLPKDNVAGYMESRVYKFDGLKQVKRFFIAHGTADDNVHIQNTFKLLDDFNLHNVFNYDMQVYPDSNHNIMHHNAYDLLMGRLQSWLMNAFDGNFDSFH